MNATALELSPLVTRRERMWPLVVASLLIHAALIAAAIVHRAPPPLDLQQKPIVAKLVRLGPKKPESWLPRKEFAPPPAAASPEPAPVAAKPAETKTVPVPVTKPVPARAAASGPSAAGRTDVLASVMSKVQHDKARADPLYGDPSGSQLGDASEGEPGDQYLALVERALRESYTLPATISEHDRMHLRATVILYVDSDGKVLRYAFEKRSGDDSFDAALERAIGAARLPPPPAEFRKKYRTEGLGVLYRP